MDTSHIPKEAETSTSKDKMSNGVLHMDTDDDEELMDSTSVRNLGAQFLNNFCKKASRAFFEQYGLISHQINSYNDFIKYGIQNIFDSIGEIVVEPGYDPSKKGEGEWRYASVTFGKVVLERPSFWTGEKFTADGGKEFLNLLPRHARLQNMTYSAKIKVKTHVQVYTNTMVKSDKFKTGKEQYLEKDVIEQDEREILIGRIPVMVKSDLCWKKDVEKGDCDFDHGGYFIVKGAEKTFIAQEQLSLKRLWVSNNPTWTVSYRPHSRRRRVYIKLVDTLKEDELLKGGAKVLSVYFFVVEIPLWILFFALGASSDKEVVHLIESDIEDTNIANILVASIHNADKECEGFRKGGRALGHIEEELRKTKFPPAESVEDCIRNYLFPNLTGFKQKARFLGYMVKCLLEAYTGRRKVDNRDDFRNKRLEMAAELLERELRVHIKHAERRMVKAMQRDLYGDRNMHPIEHYLDSSIITNGLSRAFSAGGWSHPYKRTERISGVVAMLRRTNPLQMTADMRKTRQQVLYTGKVGDARYP